MHGFTNANAPMILFAQKHGSSIPTGAEMENTIYIMAASIGRISINCTHAPGSPTTGDVYIDFEPSGVSADFGFRIPVYGLLGQAYRWSGDAWVSVSGYIFKNGNWVQFS